MTRQSFLIIGASGYIGSRLFSRAKENAVTHGTATQSTETLLRFRLDAPNEFNYEILQPADTVFLTAAISSPDICARNHDLAWTVNVIGTSAFINQVISRGGRVIFFSSDTVYGERDNPFDETADCHPSGEYAAMKSEVEKHFLGNPLFKSVRLSYVFSREDKFTKYLFGCAERTEEAELFHPFYRAIIHRDDIVEGVLELARRWSEFPQQVINFGGPEILSRIDFAKFLKRTALPNLRFRVTEPEAIFFKNRPRTIAMQSNILPKLLGRPSRCLLNASQIEFASR